MQQKVLQTSNISFHIFLTQGFQKYEKKNPQCLFSFVLPAKWYNKFDPTGSNSSLALP